MDKRIGAQLYSVRDLTQTPEDFDRLCSELKNIGYKTVQVSGTPLDAKVMREILDKYGLKAVVTHKGFDDFKNDIDSVIEYNKTLGVNICGIGMMPHEYLESIDKVNEFIAVANKACEALEREGLVFAYHNHHFEFIKVGGELVFDKLVNETNPDVFKFIVDVYWCQYAGVNPIDIINRLKDRAIVLHFKDYSISYPEFQIKMADVGYGNINWDAIIDSAEKAGSKWAMVERDDAPDFGSVEAMKRSYDFLTTKGFI